MGLKSFDVTTFSKQCLLPLNLSTTYLRLIHERSVVELHTCCSLLTVLYQPKQIKTEALLAMYPICYIRVEYYCEMVHFTWYMDTSMSHTLTCSFQFWNRISLAALPINVLKTLNIEQEREREKQSTVLVNQSHWIWLNIELMTSRRRTASVRVLMQTKTKSNKHTHTNKISWAHKICLFDVALSIAFRKKKKVSTELYKRMAM